MTFSAFISRWFGLTLPTSSAISVLAAEHYEEDDEYRLEGDAGSQDLPSDDDESEAEHEPDGYFRPSRFVLAYYEEEAAHRKDAELLLDADELVLEG